MMLICFSILTFLYLIHWIGLLFGFKQFNHFGKICSDNWFWVALVTVNCIYQTYWISIDPAHENNLLWVAFAAFALIMFCIIIDPVCNSICAFHKNQKIKRGNNG